MAAIEAVHFTCEHGGNRIPHEWRPLFRAHAGLLASHRGWDPGALTIARQMARALDAPLDFSTTSRLLVELNRSPGHPELFSTITRPLPSSERERILETRYVPYRAHVESAMAETIRSLGRGGALLHVGVHSFTPELNGEVRDADVAFLYDPSRKREKARCRAWREALLERWPGLRVRMNYPYRGAADGFITHLRRRFPATRYLGVELEVNQTVAAKGGGTRRRLVAALTASLRRALEDF